MAEREEQGQAAQREAPPDINAPKTAELAQPSFAAGELAPGFHGRWDIDKFRLGMREIKNFIVRPSGALATRPGFQYCGPTRGDYTQNSPTYGDPGHAYSRIVPFTFSSGDTFLLEFSALTMHVWKNGARAWSDTPNNWVVTPYTGLNAATGNYVIMELRFTQQGDVIYITHPNYAPYKLTRVGAGTAPAHWTLTAVSYTPTLSAPTNLSLTQGNTTHERRREWSYVVTAFDNDTGEESVASSPLSVQVFLEANKRVNRAKIEWSAVTGADSYNVYRGRNGFYGFIGTAKSTFFYDDNFQPVYSITPPTTDNPFGSSNNYPACAAFYQQRLYYARTNNAPQTIWATMTGVYNQFLRSEPPNDDDSFEHILAARRMDEIRHIIPLDSLIVLTADSEWVITGPDGGAVTPTSIEARPISFRGCSWVEPLVIGNRILYIDRTGRHVREIVDEGGGNVSGGEALTILASHLLEGHTIKRWCYQQNPDSIIWAVRDDGKLLSLTYLPEYEIWAWALHTTGTTQYEVGGDESLVQRYITDICCVTEGGEDYVYIIVLYGDPDDVNADENRWYIERMKGYGQDAWENAFLDSYKTARILTSPATVTGLDPQYGTVGVRAGSLFPTGSGDGAVGGIVAAGDVAVWEKDGEIIRFEGVQVDETTVMARLDRDCPPSMQAPQGGISAYTAENSWTLNSPLPFSDVWVNVVVDGVPERVFYDGSSTIQTTRLGVVAHVGLPYESSAVTLPALFPGGEALGMMKQVKSVTVHAISSYKFNVQDADRHGLLSDRGYEIACPRWDATIFGWDVGYREGQEFIERSVVAGPWTTQGCVRLLVPERAAGFPLQIMGISRQVVFGG